MEASRVSDGWPVAQRCMHRVERDVMRSQSYEQSLLHFSQLFAGTTGCPYYSRWIASGGLPNDIASIGGNQDIHSYKPYFYKRVYQRKRIILF